LAFKIETAFISDADGDWLAENFPRMGRSHSSYCPTCGKAGTYRWQGADHQCDCRRQLKLHQHYLLAGIGVPYQRLDWEDYVGGEIGDLIDFIADRERYLDRGIGFILAGGFGLGKTMLANLALKECVKSGYRCYATTFAQTIDMYTSTWYSLDEKHRFQRRFLQSDVLLLDDVGKEMRAKNNLPPATFDSILRSRVQAGRATLITTNMTLEELGQGYGAAVLSLLTESSMLFKVGGEDFRPESRRRTRRELDNGETRPIF
jgi:DNA replication protein DnaC